MEDNIKQKYEDLQKTIESYKNTLSYIGADIPIQCLCLPREIEDILLTNKFFRVYELMNIKLTDIKGIGRNRAAILGAKLSEFFSVEF